MNYVENVDLWIAARKREELTDSILSNHRVCSKHFISDKLVAFEDTTKPDTLEDTNPDSSISVNGTFMQKNQIYAFVLYSDYVYGQNIPFTLHEQLKNYEHQQNFELLRHLTTRDTQEGNIQNQTAVKPSQNQQIQQENIQNSHFIPTTIQPEIKSKPDVKTVQIRPSIQTNLDTFQQIVPNFHHFSSIHPNSLSGINTIQVPFPYNTLRVPYPEPVPVHVKVPVSVVKPYPLTRTVTIPVENPVYIRVHQPIQVPVPQLYQVAVPQPIEMKVPQPVYIQVLPNGQ